jgi:hypothetical protein
LNTHPEPLEHWLSTSARGTLILKTSLVEHFNVKRDKNVENIVVLYNFFDILRFGGKHRNSTALCVCCGTPVEKHCFNLISLVNRHLESPMATK